MQPNTPHAIHHGTVAIVDIVTSVDSIGVREAAASSCHGSLKIAYRSTFVANPTVHSRRWSRGFQAYKPTGSRRLGQLADPEVQAWLAEAIQERVAN